MAGQEAEARLCWTEAYQVFQELGLADTNPQIAKVMNHLLKVENLEEPEPDQKKKSSASGATKKFKKDKSKTSNKNDDDDGVVKVRAKGRKAGKARGVQLVMKQKLFSLKSKESLLKSNYARTGEGLAGFPIYFLTIALRPFLYFVLLG